MVMLPRRLRRQLVNTGVLIFTLFIVWHVFLSPDSTIRLAVHFNATRLRNHVRQIFSNRDRWLQKPARYPLELSSDVGYLIKTGYGTRHRVPAQLEAFKRAGNLLGEEGRSFLVVGDWTGVNETDNAMIKATVHDVVQMVMNEKVDADHRSHDRFEKYLSLQKAIDSGNEEEANHIGKSFGWELDALKFIMGMELLYKKMPGKKWYIILDDDTFMVKPSLELFLSHLNPDQPHYIGNAVGDFRGRFGHGGSGVIMSGAAMSRLFHRADIVQEAYYQSLDETWGDKLVATTLQKLGIYIDERYNHHFNGEPPEMTRITADRFCTPLLSFHGLRKPGAMISVGYTLSHIQNPILWGELWQHFGAYPIQNLEGETIQRDQDHVGPVDKRMKTWEGVRSAEACRQKCRGECMAWTWEEDEGGRCYVSPWMVIGAEGAKGKVSGVNWKRVERLLWECS